MSCQSDGQCYKKYIHKKYAIAVAIGILKHKPPDVSAREYCNQLQVKLQASMSANARSNLLESDRKEMSEDFSEIFNDIRTSQQPTQEDMDVFSSIQEHTQYKDRSVTDFEVLQIAENVKQSICSLYGNYPFNNLVQKEFSYLDYKVDSNQRSTQDSGYYSSELTGKSNQKKQDAVYEQLDAALKTLISFLSQATDMKSKIINYISEIFGRALDVLCSYNIYLSCCDDAIDAINEQLELFFDPNINKTIGWEMLRTFKLFLLNKSTLLINHSIMQLINKLQDVFSKLTAFQPELDVEVNNPDCMDNLFTLLQLLEDFLQQKKEYIFKIYDLPNENEEQCTQNVSRAICKMNISQKEMDNKFKQISNETIIMEKCLKVLNQVVLECVDTYPLVSFWAVDLINSINNSRTGLT